MKLQHTTFLHSVLPHNTLKLPQTTAFALTFTTDHCEITTDYHFCTQLYHRITDHLKLTALNSFSALTLLIQWQERYSSCKNLSPVHTSTTRIYGPYIQAHFFFALFAPIYTGRIYSPYTWVVCTGHPYIWTIYTGVILDTCIYGPYIRAIFTAHIYGYRALVVGCWHGQVSGLRYKFAYGPAVATPTHYLLLQ